MRPPLLRALLCAVITALLLPGAAAAAGHGHIAVPVPRAEGPLPVTAASHPFNATGFNRTPRELARDGYVEEEYLVGGTANVYEWPEGGAAAPIAAGPYETRILVRRPARRSAFSGTVVVEMLNPTSLHDLDIVWAASQEHFLRSGDVWVGLTVKPSSITALKRFDAARYGSLSMADPVPGRCTTSTWSGATAADENGLVWDMVSQVGALLRSDHRANPLRRFDVDVQLLTGYSQTAGYLATYINAFARDATLEDGRPVYDGHLPIAGANFPVPVNDCAPRPVPGSDRWVIQPPGAAPVISIQTLSDFYALNGFASRRPDVTGPDGNYRLYEVAGAGHVWATQVAYAPGAADLVRSGFSADWWEPYCERDVTTFPLEYAMNGAFANMVRWVRRGVPAPTAPRIAVSDPSSPTATPLTDADGNVLGGLRLPAIEAPRSTYYGTTPGTGTCRILWGHEVPFTPERLAERYPRPADHRREVTRSALQLAARRWITVTDALASITPTRRTEDGH